MNEPNSEHNITDELSKDNWLETVGVPPEASTKDMLALVIDPTKIYRRIFHQKIRLRFPDSEDPKINNFYDQETERRIIAEVSALTRGSEKLQSLRDRATEIMADHNNPSLESWYKKSAEKMLKKTILETIDWRRRVLDRLFIDSGSSVDESLKMIRDMLDDKEKNQYMLETASKDKDRLLIKSVDIETYPGGRRDQFDNANIDVLIDPNTGDFAGIDVTELFSYTKFTNDETLPIFELAKLFPEDTLDKFAFSGSGYATNHKTYDNGVVVGSRLHDYGEQQFWLSTRLKDKQALSTEEVLKIFEVFLTALKDNPRLPK